MDKSKYLIACDWGTSNLRLYLIDGFEEKQVGSIQEKIGIKDIHQEVIRNPDFKRKVIFQNYLKTAIDRLQEEAATQLEGNELILCSGMISSSIGMESLPYGRLPLDLSDADLPYKYFKSNQRYFHPMLIISGVEKPGDVIRGEETQAIGLIQTWTNSMVDFTLLIPGTHSKHMHIRNGKLVDFNTFMTGEVYELLKVYSTLDLGKQTVSGWDEQTFADGLKQGLQGNLLNDLFAIRAAIVQEKYSKEQAESFLSGLLIGSELHTIDSGEVPIVLLASKKLSQLYGKAFEFLNIENFKLIDETLSEQLAWRGQLHFFYQIPNLTE